MDVNLGEGASPPPPPSSSVTLSGMLVMFLLFIVVLSDYFVNNTIGVFGKRLLNNRMPTTQGYIVLGTVLVITYALVMTLMKL
jgi:hypothetical protein